MRPTQDTTTTAFQSTPAIAGERCGLHLVFGAQLLVSIHARHRWRAVPRRLPGMGGGKEVSIHARHRWRAVPEMLDDTASSTQFQSTPAIAGERCGEQAA